MLVIGIIQQSEDSAAIEGSLCDLTRAMLHRIMSSGEGFQLVILGFWLSLNKKAFYFMLQVVCFYWNWIQHVSKWNWFCLEDFNWLPQTHYVLFSIG